MSFRRVAGWITNSPARQAAWIRTVPQPCRTLGRWGWPDLDMSGWSEKMGADYDSWASYTAPGAGNLYRARDETDFPHKVRNPKNTTHLSGVVVQPFWHRKMAGICLDVLEIVAKSYPEGWDNRVIAEVWAENILELLEECDESDWKKFEDRLKMGPVEVVMMSLEDLYLHCVMDSRQRLWEKNADSYIDRAYEEYHSRITNIFTHGIPEYDEILSDDEKTWLKAADEESCSAMMEKIAEIVYHTAASTQEELREKVLERRRRKLTEPAPVRTAFGDTGSVL
eukprot:TRINITY_DN72800_c0_g1_i1.p1 TRINITY_DN72800_c0_g1~~TRINITY_DN72800_c0_g1_i1.p1  ORF type:complete len:310 (+),score=38.72 TRINITY_DN72800_c0_g1_i1:86-931(+)